MILDSKAQLASSFSPTTSGAIQVSGTYYDNVVAQDLGAGNDVGFYVQVAATATSGGSATVVFKLQAATDAAFTVPIDVILETAIPVATLVAGYQLQYKVPRGFAYRYYRLGVLIGTADLTAGTFNAWLLNDNFQDNKSYAAGYSIVAG